MAWMCPPQSVKRCEMPCRASAFDTSLPPWTCAMRALYHGRASALRPRRFREMLRAMKRMILAVVVMSFVSLAGCHRGEAKSPVEAMSMLQSPEWKDRRKAADQLG